MRKILKRPGPRGAFLLSLAGVDVLFGLGLLNATYETRQTPSYAFPDALLNLHLWGLAWLAVAAVLIVSAFRVRDVLGFGVAIGIKVLWGLLMLGGWLAGDIPRGYVSTGIWLGMACLVAVCSRHLPVVDRGRGE